MNGDLAQYTALATWATIGLRDGAAAAAPGLGLANDAFRFVRRLEFEGVGAAEAWLASLAGQGIERVWLAVDPGLTGPAEQVGPTWRGEFAFVNSLNARVGLLAGDELWRGHLAPADPPGPERRVWDVAYRAVRAPMRPQTPPLGDGVDRLERALDRAIGFAGRHPETRNWEGVFAKARALGEAEDPVPPYYQDLIPSADYPLGSRRLAAVAQAAWVFGGMGCWNDMGFQDPEIESEFQGVTGELFSAVLFALVAAVNVKLSGGGGRPGRQQPHQIGR